MADKREEVAARVTSVFRDVFDDDTLEITDETSAADILDWDSLMHINLCVALEREFKIKLNAVEIAALSNVGQLIGCVMEKTGAS